MLIFRHAVETSIGPVRKDDEFRSDLWYTETCLFSSGCTNYPHYMTYHNGGVGAMNIGGMNDQQFEKLNEMLKRGAKVDMRY